MPCHNRNYRVDLLQGKFAQRCGLGPKHWLDRRCRKAFRRSPGSAHDAQIFTRLSNMQRKRDSLDTSSLGMAGSAFDVVLETGLLTGVLPFAMMQWSMPNGSVFCAQSNDPT